MQKTVKLTLSYEAAIKLPKINLGEVVPGSYGDQTGSLGFTPRVLIDDVGIFSHEKAVFFFTFSYLPGG